MRVNLRVLTSSIAAFVVTISALFTLVKPEEGAKFEPYWMRVNASDLVEHLKEAGVAIQKAEGDKYLAIGLHVDLTSPTYLNVSRQIADVLRNVTKLALGKPVNIYAVLYTPNNLTAHILGRWACRAEVESLVKVVTNESTDLTGAECKPARDFKSTYRNTTSNSLNFTYRVIYSLDFFAPFPGDVREARQPPTIYVLAVDLAKAKSEDPMVRYEGIMYEPLRPFDTIPYYISKVENVVERFLR